MFYAAYGSNLHPARLSERTPSASLVGTSFLDGWSLRFHKRGKDRSGKCNIERGGGGVFLALYEMEAADQRELDRIEGNGYTRTELAVPGFGQCMTYRAVPDAVDDTLDPFDWYVELVVLGARTLEFDGAYIDELAATRTVVDPHSVRREHHYRLIEAIR